MRNFQEGRPFPGWYWMAARWISGRWRSSTAFPVAVFWRLVLEVWFYALRLRFRLGGWHG